MHRQSISILFSVIFLLCIAAQPILTMVDNTNDTSVASSTSEKKDKGFEILFSHLTTIETPLSYCAIENNLGYNFKKYTKPFLSLISQPPEQVFSC